MVRNFVIRLIINAVALAGAAYVVDGIALTGSIFDTLVVAFIFGLVNALVKPVVYFFSLPFLLLTLGLLSFVLNGAMLLLTARFTSHFAVDGMGPAILGSIVISLISLFLNGVLKDEKDEE